MKGQPSVTLRAGLNYASELVFPPFGRPASEYDERAARAERAAKRVPASERVGVSEGRNPSDRAFDLAAKGLIVTLFTLFAVRIGANVMATGHLTGLLLLASESLVVVLTVLRRTAGQVDRSLRARIVTTLSTLGPPLVRPSLIAPLLPGAVTVAMSAVGLSIVIAGKISIGRSFGLLPANRGIVSTGLYRVLRHPIYAGYLITHVAFVAANPTPWNAALLLASDIALLRRACCEESTLARDPQYRAYMDKVRWRVVPGIF